MDRNTTWNDALKYQLWAVFFDHLARKVANGDARIGNALAHLLDLVPSDFEKFKENIRSNPEEHARDFVSLAKKIGIPLAEDDTKKIVGAMKAAIEITEMLTKGRDLEEVANILHSAYMSNNPEAVLNRYGIDTQQIRKRVAEILKEYDLQDLIYQPEHAERKTTEVSLTTITKKEPSEVEETFKTLKNLGVDLRLETGNVAERKAKIYAWLMQNGLITVEQEGEKVTVKPTEKMHQLLAKHGKAAGAILKWAAEEGVSLEHVEPVAKILATLEEFRQIAKKKDPALAKTLEKAMKSKHTTRELLHALTGLLTIEELSEAWRERFGLSLMELLRGSPELTGAFLEAMENMRELASPSVPVEWLPFLEAAESGEGLGEALEKATLYRMTFSAYESLAVRGLPGDGREVVRAMEEVLERAKTMVPEVAPFEGLEREVETLAELVALMKDGSYIEVIEAEVTPMLERVPETRKVGLFRRESPRRKVEDFVAVLMEGNLGEEEAEEKAEELGKYLKSYMGREEARELVRKLLVPFRARLLLRKHGSAENFLFDYAHAKASRCLHIEAHLAEALRGNLNRDALLGAMAGVPSVLGMERRTLGSFERNRETLEKLLG
ncbi:hypothetical protein [Thermococcus sp.]